MADLFVDNNASATASPYETWDKAAVTFLIAVDAASAGDRIIVDSNHLDSPGGNVTYAFPGTDAAPNLVISADQTAGGSTVTYKKFENVQVDTSAGVFDILWSGRAKIYGMSMKVGDDFRFNAAADLLFDDCLFEMSSVFNACTQTSRSSRSLFLSCGSQS